MRKDIFESKEEHNKFLQDTLPHAIYNDGFTVKIAREHAEKLGYIKKSELEKAEENFKHCQLDYSEKDNQVIKYVDGAIGLIIELRNEIQRLKDSKC